MNIYQRINAVMQEVRGVEKSQRNQHGNYNYAGHEAVTEAIRASMVKHGIVQTVETGDVQLLEGGHLLLAVHVIWSSIETPESFIASTIHALQHCQTKNGNPTAQQIGQALSYAVKNFTFKTLMLTGDPDADSDSGSIEVADPAVRGEAEKYLQMYHDAKTHEDIEAAGLAIKEWGKAGDYPGLRDQLVKAMGAARKRVSGK